MLTWIEMGLSLEPLSGKVGSGKQVSRHNCSTLSRNSVISPSRKFLDHSLQKDVFLVVR